MKEEPIDNLCPRCNERISPGEETKFFYGLEMHRGCYLATPVDELRKMANKK